MKTLSLCFTFLLISCGQSYNSHSKDRSLSSLETCTDTSNTKLCEANQIIFENCANCHNSSIHVDWYSFKTDQAWIDSGYVIPGDAPNSSLIFRLKNEGGDMPTERPPLTQEEVETLKEWINNL